MAKQQQTNPERDDAALAQEVLAQINAKTQELYRLQIRTAERICELETAGVRREPTSPETLAANRVRTHLDGLMNVFAPVAMQEGKPGVELDELYLLREEIPKRLELLTRSGVAERATILAALIVKKAREWVAITKQLVLTVAALQRVVAERERLRDEFRKASGGIGVPNSLVLAEFNCLGDLKERDVRKRLVETALRLGLVSRRDLDLEGA